MIRSLSARNRSAAASIRNSCVAACLSRVPPPFAFGFCFCLPAALLVSAAGGEAVGALAAAVRDRLAEAERALVERLAAGAAVRRVVRGARPVLGGGELGGGVAGSPPAEPESSLSAICLFLAC